MERDNLPDEEQVGEVVECRLITEDEWMMRAQEMANHYLGQAAEVEAMMEKAQKALERGMIVRFIDIDGGITIQIEPKKRMGFLP